MPVTSGRESQGKGRSMRGVVSIQKNGITKPESCWCCVGHRMEVSISFLGGKVCSDEVYVELGEFPGSLLMHSYQKAETD